MLTQLVFLVGLEASRADVCMSVVAVLRQSYYLVVDLHSKAAIAAHFWCRCFPNCPLILQCKLYRVTSN